MVKGVHTEVVGNLQATIIGSLQGTEGLNEQDSLPLLPETYFLGELAVDPDLLVARSVSWQETLSM